MIPSSIPMIPVPPLNVPALQSVPVYATFSYVIPVPSNAVTIVSGVPPSHVTAKPASAAPTRRVSITNAMRNFFMFVLSLFFWFELSGHQLQQRFPLTSREPFRYEITFSYGSLFQDYSIWCGRYSRPDRYISGDRTLSSLAPATKHHKK